MFISVKAGSSYGSREALYEVVEDHLVLRDEGNHDGLSGNSQALDFEGLTVNEAKEKASAINDEPVGHSFDGCHACYFSIDVAEVDPPDWYTYEEPMEAKVVRDALASFRARAVEVAE